MISYFLYLALTTTKIHHQGPWDYRCCRVPRSLSVLRSGAEWDEADKMAAKVPVRPPSRVTVGHGRAGDPGGPTLIRGGARRGRQNGGEGPRTTPISGHGRSRAGGWPWWPYPDRWGSGWLPPGPVRNSPARWRPIRPWRPGKELVITAAPKLFCECFSKGEGPWLEWLLFKGFLLQ